MLTRQQLLGSHRTKEIEVAELGGTVFVRAISGKERSALFALNDKMQKDEMTVAEWGAACVAVFLCDADGGRMFKDDELALVQEIDGSALDVIFRAGMDFNKIGRTSLEDAEKNSDATTTEGGTTT